MSTKIPITIEQSADFLVTYLITDLNNQPINLVGINIESQMTRPGNSSFVPITFTCNGFANGYLTLTLPSAQTINITGNYVYDVDFKDSSNLIIRVIEGLVTVTPSVTVFS